MLNVRLISSLLVRSVREESDQALAARLWRAVRRVGRLGTTHAHVKRECNYFLIYYSNFYVLYYWVVELYAYDGEQGWWGAPLACTRRSLVKHVNEIWNWLY